MNVGGSQTRASAFLCLPRRFSSMSGVIEQLGTLRAFGIDGDEAKLQLLLRTANYNVQTAINHYFDSGLPDLPPSKSGSASRVVRGRIVASTGIGIASNPIVPIVSPRPSEPATSRVVKYAATPTPKLEEPGWPKFIGERFVTGYSTRCGSIEHQEHVAIISEGSRISLTRGGGGVGGGKRNGGLKGSGAQHNKRGQKGGATGMGRQSGRHKRSSAGAMAHILFRSTKGGVEGRLPQEVCTFLAPLMQEGLVRADAEAVCDLPGLGVFGKVPLMLSIQVEAGLFALDPVEEKELYRSAYALLEFAQTGELEQEQPRAQQGSPRNSYVAGSRTPASISGGSAARDTLVRSASEASPAAATTNVLEDEGGCGDFQGQEEKEKEVRDEDVKQLYDDEAQLCGMPEAPDPKLFAEGLSLRRYQRQALAWMIQREKRRCVTEEDCSALSLGDVSARAAGAPSPPPDAEGLDRGGDGAAAGKGTGSDTREVAVIRNGCVHVAFWDSVATVDGCGDGPGVAIHPLWERRAAASLVPKLSPALPNSSNFSVGGKNNRDESFAARGGEASLSHPVPFYVNVYLRRFQREFPGASLGCRGGILADEMGMGKTVMLLSLILTDKERRQRGEDINNESAISVVSPPQASAAEHERDAQGCCSQRQGPLLPETVLCFDAEDEQTGKAAGAASAHPGKVTLAGLDISRPSGDDGYIDCGEVGVKNAKRHRKSGPDPVATKRQRREASESGASSGGDFTGVASACLCAGVEPDDVKDAAEECSAEGKSPLSRAGARIVGLVNGGNVDGSSRRIDREAEYGITCSLDMNGSNKEDGGKGKGDPDSESTSSPRSSSRGKARAAPARGSNGRDEGKSETGGAEDHGVRRGGGGAGSDPSALVKDPFADLGSEEKEDIAVVNKKGGVGDREAAAKPGVTRANKQTGGTLVVCPMSMIGQWRGEIESKTRKGALTVCFHYGSVRSRSARDLCRFDVVLTTYGVISSEMNKHEAGFQAGAEAAEGARSSVSKRRTGAAALLGLRWRRVILDEAHFIRNTATEQSRACLFVEADQRWAVTGTPIQNSLDDVAALLAFLRHEPWSDRGWWRKVIADPYKDGDLEALRRLKTVLAPILLRRTKKTLDSRGRPIVELPSKEVKIVRLQFSPVEREFYEALKKRSKVEFEGYLAAGTVMKSYIAILTLLLRLRQACNHPFLVLGEEPAAAELRQEQPLLSHPSSSFSPFTTRSTSGVGLALSSLTTDGDSVDKSVEGAGAGEKDPAKTMPPSYVEELYRRFQHPVSVVTEGCSGETREGYLGEVDGGWSRAFVDSVVGQLQEEGNMSSAECPVCLEQPMEAPALTTCAHLMCRACLQDCLRREACCPVCRSTMAESDIIDVPESRSTGKIGCDSKGPNGSAPTFSREIGAAGARGSRSGFGASSSLAGGSTVRAGGRDSRGDWVSSTKLERLELELHQMKKKRAGAKAVVFSQWTHMLDLAERSLSRGGWTFRRLDGSMSQQKRESALKSFSADGSVTVMLVSLKAGGVGLNLTAASTVILLDPWWNPAVEDQAIDRIHRLGQLNDVSVKRFVVSGTVEDEMLALQEVKGRMAKSALASGSLGESQKLRVEDLVQFFK